MPYREVESWCVFLFCKYIWIKIATLPHWQNFGCFPNWFFVISYPQDNEKLKVNMHFFYLQLIMIWYHIYHDIYIYIIQIKICAEYWGMLPRPRLVCQEPGLRPISRIPGVPDKSSRGLGSMTWCSAQILICFIAYISLFFIPLWVWLGFLQDCQYAQCPLPLSIVIITRLLPSKGS